MGYRGFRARVLRALRAVPSETGQWPPAGRGRADAALGPAMRHRKEQRRQPRSAEGTAAAVPRNAGSNNPAFHRPRSAAIIQSRSGKQGGEKFTPEAYSRITSSDRGRDRLAAGAGISGELRCIELCIGAVLR